MQPKIYCKETRRGVLEFYLANDNVTYYLFSQKFKVALLSYFENGVYLDKALDYSRCYNNFALVNVKKKLIKYIRYIEKEYDTSILRGGRIRHNYAKVA